MRAYMRARRGFPHQAKRGKEIWMREKGKSVRAVGDKNVRPISKNVGEKKKNVGDFPKNVGDFSENVGENFEDVGDSKITLRLFTQKHGSKWSRYEKYSFSHAH